MQSSAQEAEQLLEGTVTIDKIGGYDLPPTSQREMSWWTDVPYTLTHNNYIIDPPLYKGT